MITRKPKVVKQPRQDTTYGWSDVNPSLNQGDVNKFVRLCKKMGMTDFAIMNASAGLKPFKAEVIAGTLIVFRKRERAAHLLSPELPVDEQAFFDELCWISERCRDRLSEW